MSADWRANPALEPGFGIYLHWPFCLQKCPYCDFNSHVRQAGPDEARFAAAFVRELEVTARLTGPRTVSSIFFGGGTPSLMSAAAVGTLIETVARLWHLARDAEITLEANPSSVEAERFRGYRSAGVNRVSLGVQSLDDAELKKLGRLHSAAEAIAALAIARRTFERFSFDLIYARPGQTLANWRSELSGALALAGDHLSLYQLTIEPDTPYARLHAVGKLITPPEAAAFDMFALTGAMTGAAGLPSYETSNHARPGQESRHNLLYWRYGEYAGVGPGAHGRIIVDGVRQATTTEKNPERWLAAVENHGHGRTEMTPLTRAEQADEMLLMGMRLAEGVDLDRLQALTGMAPAPHMIAMLKADGLVETLPPPRSARPDPDDLADFDCIMGCIGPGQPLVAAPVITYPARLRAIGDGRFVLNRIVAELASTLEPVPDARMDTPQASR